MKNYEFIFLTRPDLTSKKLEGVFAGLEEQFKKISAKIEKKEKLGEKKLAYLIKDSPTANFWVWNLSFKESPKIAPLTTFLGRQEEIVRYLFLVKKDLEKGGK